MLWLPRSPRMLHAKDNFSRSNKRHWLQGQDYGEHQLLRQQYFQQIHPVRRHSPHRHQRLNHSLQHSHSPRNQATAARHIQPYAFHHRRRTWTVAISPTVASRFWPRTRTGSMVITMGLDARIKRDRVPVEIRLPLIYRHRKKV